MRFSQPLQPLAVATATMQQPREVLGYEILDDLGEGAGSTIYAASERDTGQICALKHVIVRCDADRRFVDQLETEHEVGQRINHPGLRRTIAFIARGSWPRKTSQAALVMELFDGTPLSQQAPGDIAGSVDIFIQAAEALNALHTLGYVHGDFKPGNLLLAADGAVKVIDFGQACRIGTAKTRIQGTPEYMAPEQARCEALDVRTDVYSLGASLYWRLCGRKLPTLFTAGRGENSFLVDAQVNSPRDINPAVPENLSNLVMECVRSRAEKRPSGMMEVGRRLEIIRFSMQRPILRAS